MLRLRRPCRRLPAPQLRRQLGLHRPAHFQRLTQPLVLDDGALIDSGDPVEGAVGQGQPLVTNLDPTVGEVVNGDLLAGQGAGPARTDPRRTFAEPVS